MSRPSLAHLRALVQRGPVRSADAHPHQGWKQDLAVWVTDHVATMECAIAFGCIGVGSLIGVLTGSAVLALACGAVSSYFLQLVLLPLIMLGDRVSQAHADARAERDHEALTHTVELLGAMSGQLDHLVRVHGGPDRPKSYAPPGLTGM